MLRWCVEGEEGVRGEGGVGRAVLWDRERCCALRCRLTECTSSFRGALTADAYPCPSTFLLDRCNSADKSYPPHCCLVLLLTGGAGTSRAGQAGSGAYHGAAQLSGRADAARTHAGAQQAGSWGPRGWAQVCRGPGASRRLAGGLGAGRRFAEGHEWLLCRGLAVQSDCQCASDCTLEQGWCSRGNGKGLRGL